jgi:hypothetical protein
VDRVIKLGNIRAVIPEDLHDKLRMKKVKEKTTINELIKRAIEEMLERDCP